jgi:TonB-dependent receptor
MVKQQSDRDPAHTLIAHAIALILAGAAMQAVAQEAPAPVAEAATEELEEIVVTGFRASLEQSLDVKRSSATAVDSILAEDIADFPDLNLAESLQRIPGVSIARDAGEGRQITVRGLGPQFTRVRINGMEALSTAGGTDAAGGTNRSRSFDFNVFASELFNELTVRKTAAAEIEEGSLGATVDLRASRPFNYNGLTFVTSLQGGYNDLSEEFDPRAAVLLSNTFADGRFGALMSVAYTQRTLNDDGSSTVRWQKGGGTNSFTTLAPGYKGPTLAELNAAFRPRIPRYDMYENEQDRLGVTGSLQWAPTDATAINFDALYSKLDGTRTEMFLQAPVFSAAGPANIGNVDVREAEIRTGRQGQTAIVYGLFDDVDVRSEQRFDDLSTEFTQFTLDGSHDFGNGLSVTALVGTAESEHDNPRQTTLLFDAFDIDGYVYDFRKDDRLPLISYGALDVTNPAAWKLTQIRLRPQTADNSYDTIEGAFAYEFNPALTLKGGIQYKQYEFETTEQRRSNGTTANQEAIIPASAGAVPLADYGKVVKLSGLGAPSGTTLRWLVPNVRQAGNLLNLYDQSVFPMGIETALGNNQQVSEDDTGAFLQLDFNVDLAGLPVRGNFGARYVQTDLTATGYTFSGGLPVRITAEHDYDKLLPSVNVVMDFADDFLVRMSYAEVMTRPALGSLAPSTTISVSGNNRTVTTGNTFLDPYEADAYDLSFEWYFAEESLLSLAFFYKDIGTFISTSRDTRPFANNPYGLPEELAIQACGTVPGCSILADWQFSVPSNTPGGDLKGFEGSYQQPFSFLDGFWGNFGLILNYTYVDSEVDYLNVDGSVAIRTDLTGLSQNAYNATLYYEDDRFSSRISGAYRDEYLTTVPGRNSSDVEGTAATFNLDFSATWNYSDNLQFTFEALNLTDEFQDQWVDSRLDLLSFYHHTGTQYYLGLRYKY